MKQKVEDHCKRLNEEPSFAQAIHEKAWQYHTEPWLPDQKYSFDMMIHKNDKGPPIAGAANRPAHHMELITSQVAGSVREYFKTTESNLPPVVLDIGVNYGWVTFTAASMGAQVFSFEPMQSNIEFLRTALCLSSAEMREHVTLFDFGLSESTQDCFIASLDNNIGDGQVYCLKDGESKETFKPPGNQVIRETVHLRRLDDVAKDAPADWKARLVTWKMDTEGHEPFVISGAKEFLRNHAIPTIHTEFNNADAKSMMSFFVDELGYNVLENRPHHLGRMGKAPLTRDVAMDMSKFNGLHDLLFTKRHQITNS